MEYIGEMTLQTCSKVVEAKYIRDVIMALWILIFDEANFGPKEEPLVAKANVMMLHNDVTTKVVMKNENMMISLRRIPCCQSALSISVSSTRP